LHRQQGLFLTLLFIFIFSAANAYAREDKTKISSILPKLYSHKNVALDGSYYSIGTFREIKNAYELKVRHLKFKPLILLVKKKNNVFYRVIVGPITNKNKKKVKMSLIGSRVNDLWLIKINGLGNIVYKKIDYSNSKKLKVKSKPQPTIKIISGLKTDGAGLKKRDILEYNPGKTFSDCKMCPMQVVIPAGDFIMGESNGGISEDAYAINVTIPKSFSISRFEITFALWDACLANGGCSGYRPPDEGWGRATRPVINVNRDDLLSYINWLTKKTGKLYRLPSEAEWEYSARAGTATAYWWGRESGINKAVCQDCGSIYDGEKTARVGSFSMNKFGLFDTSGNVWEWVEDCYSKDSYQSHREYPKPFYIVKNFQKYESCSRVLRGGGWDVASIGIKSSFRFASMPSVRSKFYGFRVVREIN